MTEPAADATDLVAAGAAVGAGVESSAMAGGSGVVNSGEAVAGDGVAPSQTSELEDDDSHMIESMIRKRKVC